MTKQIQFTRAFPVKSPDAAIKQLAEFAKKYDKKAVTNNGIFYIDYKKAFLSFVFAGSYRPTEDAQGKYLEITFTQIPAGISNEKVINELKEFLKDC